MEKYFHQHHCQFRPSPGADLLRQLYVEERRGIEFLIRRFGTHIHAVRRWLREANIQIRPQGQPLPPKEIDGGILRSRYVEQQQTVAEIATALGTTPRIVLRELRRHGIQSRRSGPRPRPARRRPLPDKAGYIQLHLPDHQHANSQGYVREHVVVMEEKLGRRLHPGEVVHHVDEDKTNNHPDNLELYPSIGEHTRHHNLERSTARRLREMSDEQLGELHRKYSTVEIGKMFGTSPNTVGRLLRQRGFELRQGRRRSSPPPTQ